MPERVESDQTENFVVHKPLDRFFINSQGFHNAHLLRATLPRDILAPIPLFPDRKAKHQELAAQLREKQSTQRAKKKAAAEKRKASEEDCSDDGEPPKKKRKTKHHSPRRVAATSDSMVRNRGKRKITRTKKALASPESEEDTDTDMSDGERLSGGSDSEYLE
jgi:hypothetical protein